MSPWSLSLKSLRNRKFTVSLTVLSIALSTALLLGVERIRREARTGFTNTLSGTDLIVGARSGPVPLLLYSVFRIGNPTQNIRYETYTKFSEHPRVAWTIPLSLGDSYQGYRVLGTSVDYFNHYRYADKRNLDFSGGEAFRETYGAVLGAEVARALGHGLGDRIVLAHGAGEVSFVEHADKPFKVVGILKSTGTPVDRTVHVSLEGIEAIHIGWNTGAGGHDHDHPGHDHAHDPLAEALGETDLTPKQITAFLVGMHDRGEALMLQRGMNTWKGEPLTAILPGLALQELWSVMGVAENSLMVISIFVVLVALAGMLAVLMTSLNERRREMAILRSVGARPRHILWLILGEAFCLALAGLVGGLLLLAGLMVVAGPLLQSRFGIHLSAGVPVRGEWIMMGAVLLASLLIGLVPALRSYCYSLSDGLQMRS
jgi:putative ABC transport system permease protein